MTEIILESISDGVFTVDADWVVTSFNRAAEKITGIKKKKAIGSYCFEVFKSNMCESECPLRKTIKTGKPIINKTGYIINPQGERIPISVSTAILLDKNGNSIGGAETFRDLSEIEKLKTELKSRATLGDMTSNNPVMRGVFDTVIAASSSGSTILIQGETGTGKELLARTIHSLSPRADGPFIAVNCGALPDTLLESELFGYKKGAFTGAEKDKPGRFALARGGTIFLDEIADIPLPLQVKLLRVLQEKEYEPLGSVKSEKTDVRVISATNRNLKDMITQKEFRQDLFYRINIITLELPPLRFRKEDIPPLAERFLGKYARIMNKHIEGIHPDVYSLFYAYEWPGNIRELENIMERAVVLTSKKIIELECLPPDLSGIYGSANDQPGIHDVKEKAEKISIIRALEKNGYDRESAAHELGINRATFYRKVKRYKIDLSGK